MSQLILHPFRRFTYVTGSFCNPSVASPTSQLILQPFFRFSYVTGSSLMSPGEPPMLQKGWFFLGRAQTNLAKLLFAKALLLKEN